MADGTRSEQISLESMVVNWDMHRRYGRGLASL